MLDLLDLLRIKGFKPAKKTKLVRHQSSQYDLHKLLVHDHLEVYQRVQGKPVFSNCEQIVSFLGMEHTKGLFVGVYDVKGCTSAQGFSWPKDYLYPEMPLENHLLYSLVENENFAELKERVVINWGGGTRSWTQWLRSKEIVEILPKGYVQKFPGYFDFVLDYVELQKIMQNPNANREWHRHLEAVSGIYLITDSKTGKQYVGSAFGKGGFLGRWKQYALTGHGGNTQLKQLLGKDTLYAKNFNFTILRTLQKSLTNREVIQYEILYKEKLGTRAFGLNSN